MKIDKKTIEALKTIKNIDLLVNLVKQQVGDNPKVAFELLDEINENIKVFRDVEIKDLEKLQGADGKTPELGVDYFTPEELDKLEEYIVSLIPELPNGDEILKDLRPYAKKQVKALMKQYQPQDGVTPTAEDIKQVLADNFEALKGKDGSPDTADEVLTKVNKSKKQINPSRVKGLLKTQLQVRQNTDDIDDVKKDISNTVISIMKDSSGGGGGGGSGDMEKATYDTDNNGIVDNSEKLGNQLPAYYAKESEVEKTANKGVANGYAGLDASSKINPSQLPALAISETFVVVSEVAQLALTVQEGDVAVRSDENKSYIALNDTNATMADWQELLTPTDQVQSVFGRTGVVTAQSGDYTADQITETPTKKILTATERTDIANNKLKVSADGSINTHSDVDTTGESNGKVLTYNSITNKYEPQTPTSGVTDHGLLSGLGDDDHTQYHNNARGDARYHTKTVQDATDSIQDSAIALNTAKVTNATHTGEVTGSGALTVNKTIITNKTAVTPANNDYILISDTSDFGNLKKVLKSDLGGGGGGASSINDLTDGKTDPTSVFLGAGAGLNDDGNNNNTAVGINALQSNTTGNWNTAQGFNALQSNTTGSFNSAQGINALRNNTGSSNTAQGFNALQSNTTGSFNSAQGINALRNNTGSSNTAQGAIALFSNTTGTNNTGIGYRAGINNSPFNITTQHNRIVLGNNSITNAYIRVGWTVTSDKRDKTDIEPIKYGLDFIKDLKPVSFHRDERTNYLEEKEEAVIEEVEEKNEKTGKVKTVKKVIQEEKIIRTAKKQDGSRKDEARQLGFLAQDMVATEKKFGATDRKLLIADDEQAEKLKIQETALIPVLVKAIQEQQAQIDELKKLLTNK